MHDLGPFRIAFSGHADWSKIVDGPQARLAVRKAFEIVRDSLPLAKLIGSQFSNITLLTGIAPGADRLAMEAWNEGQAMGPIHAVLPFLDPDGDTSTGWTDNPDKAKLTTCMAGLGQDYPFTVLNGLGSEKANPPRSAHLDLARFMIGWADALVVIWNGAAPAGPGGTTDAVRLAVSKGIPILWVRSNDGSGPYLIDPENMWPDTSFLELLRGLEAEPPPLASATALGDCLARLHAFPVEESEQRGLSNWRAWQENAGIDSAQLSLWSRAKRLGGDQFFWRTYANFKKIFKKPKYIVRTDFPDPIQTYPATLVSDTPKLATLNRAQALADDLADKLANAHRSQQVLFLILAVFAIAIGVCALLFPDQKVWFVGIELLVLLFLFGIWWRAKQLYRHRRWSDARAFAERLRALNATWPLGTDVSDTRGEPVGTWIEWETRNLRRIAGPPTGAFTQDRQTLDIDHAINQFITGQRRYHMLNADSMGRFHHGIERIEAFGFWFLVLVLTTFLMIKSIFHIDNEDLLHTISAFVTICSAVIPAIGAACIALDAKLGIDETHERSQGLAACYDALAREIKADPSYHNKLQVLKEAARLLTSETEAWREGAVRRKIVRGG